ncbi:MAG TPA: hypothetical protein VHW92_03040 [Mycobacteriales bacterium]|nr:hypothetical protein [Mycobacteriales bacterium]
MTTLVIEQFAAPDSDRAIRRLELTRRRAAEELAGRTVWCVSSVRAGRRAADALRRRLRALPDDGLASQGIPMREGQTLTRVTENGDQLLGSEVRAGDVVVLHDPIAAALADAVRARGAHAIWWLPVERLADAADEVWALAHCMRPRVDAYVTAWQRRGPSGADRASVAAFMSGPDVVYAKELAAGGAQRGYSQLGWTSLLAEVVCEDHDEHVGGRLHPRPVVARR